MSLFSFALNIYCVSYVINDFTIGLLSIPHCTVNSKIAFRTSDSLKSPIFFPVNYFSATEHNCKITVLKIST